MIKKIIALSFVVLLLFSGCGAKVDSLIAKSITAGETLGEIAGINDIQGDVNSQTEFHEKILALSLQDYSKPNHGAIVTLTDKKIKDGIKAISEIAIDELSPSAQNHFTKLFANVAVNLSSFISIIDITVKNTLTLSQSFPLDQEVQATTVLFLFYDQATSITTFTKSNEKTMLMSTSLIPYSEGMKAIFDEQLESLFLSPSLDPSDIEYITF